MRLLDGGSTYVAASLEQRQQTCYFKQVPRPIMQARQFQSSLASTRYFERFKERRNAGNVHIRDIRQVESQLFQRLPVQERKKSIAKQW